MRSSTIRASSAPTSTTAATSHCTWPGAAFEIGWIADTDAALRGRFDTARGRRGTRCCAGPRTLRCKTQPHGPSLDGTFRITAESGVRGVATSGWRGRSFSLGIADSATVLAATAAQADAAATVIANAVDADDPRIRRAPANRLRDDSDLGDRLVTCAVGALPPAVVDARAGRRRRGRRGRDPGRSRDRRRAVAAGPGPHLFGRTSNRRTDVV